MCGRKRTFIWPPGDYGSNEPAVYYRQWADGELSEFRGAMCSGKFGSVPADANHAVNSLLHFETR